MLKFLAVGMGGFIGSTLRYAMTFLPIAAKSGFPFTTLLINFLGSFLLGFISAVTFGSANSNIYLRLFLTVGLCGGFTTFSTFALENVDLIFAGKHLLSFLYISCSVISCVAGAIAGKILADLI